MKKRILLAFTLCLFLILTFGQVMFSATISCTPPMYADDNLNYITAFKGVLNSFDTDRYYRCRIYNVSDQVDLFDGTYTAGVPDFYIGSTYASSCPIPIDANNLPTADYIQWVYGKNSDGLTSGKLRTRHSSDGFSSTYATSLTINWSNLSSAQLYTISGSLSSGGGYDLTQHYTVLAFDALSNLIHATMSMKTSGNYTLPIHAATLYVATNGVSPNDGSSWTAAFTTIQAAIDAVSTINGDEIIVGSSDGHGTGSYTENVNVNKQLTIQSENGYATTTVNADVAYKDVFYVAYDASGSEILYNVTIDGFTTYGATSGTHAGIYLNNAEDCLIQNNRCSIDQSNRNVNGIYLSGSNRNAVLDNICNYNSNNGIYLNNSMRNTIANNECKDNVQNGIQSYNTQSNVNTISSNNIKSYNTGRGIYLSNSTNNFILKNIFLSSGGTDLNLESGASWNRIYLNSFNSTTNINSSCTNYWRPGKETSPVLNLCYFYSSTCHSNFLGNYWSNVSGSDTNGDGILNTTYAADGGTDFRPLASSTISDYHIQAWYLNNDGNMYEDATDKAPYSKLVSSTRGSEIWIADEAAQVGLNFPSGQWYGQICIVDENGDAPTNLHTFKVEIGSSTVGTDFTEGPYATIIADGTNKAFEYQTNSAAVPVSYGNYLALRITNNNATNYYIWTGGAWSYTSSPGNGDPNYSLPVELSTFTAQYLNNIPTLYWVTQSETDNIGFYVYRNMENDFSEAIQVSELVSGHGTTSEPHYYIFEDIIENAFPGDTYWYWLESVDFGGMINHYDKVAHIVIPDNNDPGNSNPEEPEEFGLFQNNPNPFNPKTEKTTKVSFNLKEQAYVEINIYNIKGELVKSIYDGFNTADEAVWDGKDRNGNLQATGIYLYELKVNNKMYSTKRIILIR